MTNENEGAGGHSRSTVGLGIFRVKRCDNCGKFNPPVLDGNPRLCASCATPDGFYKATGAALGANGKICHWRLQFPVRIRWIGWWKLG